MCVCVCCVIFSPIHGSAPPHVFTILFSLIVVKELSAQCVGADELRQQRAKIQELANNTSAQLKRNVYQNYMQFIETAKEISHLESEMYQLSQLLSEQRALLSTLGSTRTAGVVFEDLSESQQENSNDTMSKEEEQKQKLIQLVENVEGALVGHYNRNTCPDVNKSNLYLVSCAEFGRDSRTRVSARRFPARVRPARRNTAQEDPCVLIQRCPDGRVLAGKRWQTWST